jgi:hypothetical protein
MLTFSVWCLSLQWVFSIFKKLKLILTFDIHFEETFIYAHKGDFFKKIITLVFSGIRLKYKFTSLKNLKEE